MTLKHLILTSILCSLLSCSTTPENTNTLVLKGAKIFDGNGNSIENAVIIIQDGVIQEVGDSSLETPKTAQTLNLEGKFVTPGLIDSHIHFSQTGFFDGRPDALDIRDSIDFDKLQSSLKNNPEPYYEAYLRAGVTAVYDVGGFLWNIERQQSAANNPKAPHVAASGPLLSGWEEDFLSNFNTSDEKQMVYLSSPKIGREAVKQYSELGSTGIKIWGLVLNDSTFMESVRAVADETKKQENKLIVHAVKLDQAKEALRLGAKVLVHSVTDFEVDDEFIKMAKANDIIYQPTTTVIDGYLKAYKSLNEETSIDDPNSVMDKRSRSLLDNSTHFKKFSNPEFISDRIKLFEEIISKSDSIMMLNLKKVYDNGIKISVATDAGNPFTFHGISIYNEMEKMQTAGIPASELIVMATKNGAIAMDRIDDFGTLEKGKLADLIVLEKDPSVDIANMRSITHVMRGGLMRPVDEEFN